MKIHESGENYLETILMLKRKHGAVRAVDVATELGFSKASVSIALKNFREHGYVTVDKGGDLSLTEKGLKLAEIMLERHETLTSFLVSLGVSPAVAAIDACKIEHDISDETFECIKRHLA